MRKPLLSKLLLFTWLVAILTAPGVALAVPGDLILTFGQDAAPNDGIIVENPSGGDDQAYDIAVDSTGIYLSGSYVASGSNEWRIEKRDLTTGALCTTTAPCGGQAFDTDGIITHSSPLSGGEDIAYDITIDGSYLYIAGGDMSLGGSNMQYRIEKRKLDTGALCTAAACGTAFDVDGILPINLSNGFDGPYDIAVDTTGIYIAGYDQIPGNSQWRIIKRSLADGSSLWSQKSNPSSDDENPQGVAVGATGVYIVGFDNATSPAELRIEKRRLDNGNLCDAANAANCGGTAFDTDGIIVISGIIAYNATGIAIDAQYMYVLGYAGNDWIIQKRNLGNGALVTSASSSSLGQNPSSIVIDSTAMYIAGPANNNWHIEKRDLSDLSLIGGFTYNSGIGGVVISNPSGSPEGIRTIALDASGIYVAGYDSIPVNEQWRIEKRVATGAGARGGTYVDCGVRVNVGGAAVALACEPSGTVTSRLRINKSNQWWGIGLVPTNDPNGSKLRIQTPSGVQAIREY